MVTGVIVQWKVQYTMHENTTITTSGQLKIIIIIEIKHLFQCPGQDRQQQPTVTHNTKHKKNKTTKTVCRGEGLINIPKHLGKLKEKSNIKFVQQSVKTFREAQRGE